MFFKRSGKGQAVKHEAPDRVTGRFWGPGGNYRGGVPRLRTSEFWIPDLGDLEAMDLDTLEYHNLVVINPAPQQPGGPTRGPADFVG